MMGIQEGALIRKSVRKVYKIYNKEVRRFSDVSASFKRPLLSVAPMMEYTTQYQRAFMRLISKETILYTEMVSANTIVHRPDSNHLTANFNIEDPVVLQVGGWTNFALLFP
jgi:tRNA-dihydrouridine synthase A